jgi:tetratricopeptide (TPR) repeat protein
MSASIPLSPKTVEQEFAEALRMSRRGETHAALKRARTAFALARETRDAATIRRGMNVVAMCQASHGFFIEAVADAIDAYEAATKAGDTREACHAATTLVGASGLMLGGRAYADTALKLLGRCLAQAEYTQDAVLECRVRMLRGMRLGTMDRFDEAEHDFAVALKKRDGAPDNIPAAMLVLNLAALAIKRAKTQGQEQPEYWDLAIVRNNESVEIAIREQNPAVESRSYFNIADVHQQRGQLPEALAAYNRALLIATKWKQRDQIINTQMARGALLLEQNNSVEALVAFEHAFHEAELHRPSPQCNAAAQRLADAHRQQANREHAALAAEWQKRADAEHKLFTRESAETKLTLERFWVKAETAIPLPSALTNP